MLLPFLSDRPVVMQRVPDGIYGEAFYEKQAPKGAPEWVRTVPVPSDAGRKNIDFVIADSVASLVWLAQIASVECHAWTSRWPNLDEPDYAVIDLDPFEPITYDDVRAVGRLVHTVLDRFGLLGFPKTSGGAGLQIFIPLRPGHTYGEVREFCTGVGRLITAVYPEKATLEPSIPKRKGHVFVDANQNARGKTLVAPYSVRPYPGAPVSCRCAGRNSTRNSSQAVHDHNGVRPPAGSGRPLRPHPDAPPGPPPRPGTAAGVAGGGRTFTP